MKKTIAVKRYLCSQEYVFSLLEMVHSEEMKQFLADFARDHKQKFNRDYFAGAVAGFTLAIYLTHNFEDETV